MKEKSINELCQEVEQQNGKINQKKRDFALLKLQHPCQSNADLTRQVGAKPSSAKQT